MSDAPTSNATLSEGSMRTPALRLVSGPEVVDEAIQLARQNYGALVVAALLPQLPDFGIDFWNSTHGVAIGVWPELLLSMAMGSLASACAARVAMDALEGRVPDPARALRMTLRRARPVILSGLFQAIAGFVGMICLLIPGFYLLSVFGLIPALPVLEPGLDAGDALRRSGTLTEGARRLAFGAWVVPHQFLYVVTVVLGVLVARSMGHPAGELVARLVGSCIAIAALPFLAAIQVRLYVELRMRKEAIDIEWAVASLGAGTAA